MKRVIVALDEMDAQAAYQFVKERRSHLKTVKIGLELWNGSGPELAKRIAGDFGVGIFLDLKIHDIPNTMQKAIRALKGLPITFLTVHMAAGKTAMMASVEEAFVSLPGCTLLGVSYLTSLEQKDFSELWDADGRVLFKRIFEMGLSAKVPGMVLSSHELPLLKDAPVTKVCPGIRFCEEISSGKVQDQKRVMSPEDAFRNGADYLVMGRSLTKLTPSEFAQKAASL